MALVRWEPARELTSLHSDMNRLFSTFFDTPTAASGQALARRWVPAMDLVEQDAQFVLRADLPGLSRDDVTIEFDRDVLTIAGERSSAHEEQSEGRRRIERATGRFSRSVRLPDGIDPAKLAARFDNGVLEITIPKPVERTPHRVEISAGDAPVEIGDAA